MKKYATFLFLGLLATFFLFAGPQAKAADASRITILYTSDTHGHITGGMDSLGMDVIAGVRRSLPHAALVDAGDFLHGTHLANFDQGESIVRVMKAAGYLVAAVGNHEFAYNRDVLLTRKAEAETGPSAFTFLSANVKDEEDGLLFAPSTATTLDGVKVCFFGLTTPRSAGWGTPSAVEGLVFEDEVSTASAQARSLRKQGCDMVVALTHIGSEEKLKVTSEDIGKKTSGIDVIIDGHSHVTLDRHIPDGPLLVSPGARARRLGRLDIAFDRQTRRIVEIKNSLLSVKDTANVSPDAAVTALLAEISAKAQAGLSKVRGEAVQSLAYERKRIQKAETPLGDFMADALRAECKTDVGLINGGYIAGGIPEGPVTTKDLMDALRFGGKAYRMELTGEELRRLMEYSVRKLPKAKKYFLQVSGLVARIEQGNRLRKRVAFLGLEDGNAVEDSATYSVGMNEFIAFGGGEFEFLAEKPRQECGVTVEEALARHLARTDAWGYGKDRGERLVIVP